jgi:hypothetical protein
MVLSAARLSTSDAAAELHDPGGAGDCDEQDAGDGREQHRYREGQVAVHPEVADFHAVGILQDKDQQQDQHDRGSDDTYPQCADAAAADPAAVRGRWDSRWCRRAGVCRWSGGPCGLPGRFGEFGPRWPGLAGGVVVVFGSGGHDVLFPVAVVMTTYVPRAQPSQTRVYIVGSFVRSSE